MANRLVFNNRKEAKAQGFYDGRFRTKVVKDAKKEARKRACRTPISKIFRSI